MEVDNGIFDVNQKIHTALQLQLITPTFFMKTLSIIVPSYNMEAYLPKCLGSLVIDAEHMEKLEVLVVNDGSKDRTSEIAHEFEAKWPGAFKVIDKPNGNYGSCINAALPFATGTWVKVLDADDWFKTENLPEFLDFLARADADVDLVFSAYTRYRPTGEVVHHSEWPFPTDGAFDFDVFADFSGNDLTMHAYTYRTDHVRGLGYRQTEGVSYSDTEWTCIPLAGVKRIAYYPKDVYQYLVGRPGQTMEEDRFAASFGMMAAVVLHMVKAAKVFSLKKDGLSYGFARRRIVESIENVYRVGCFGVNGRKANIDVVDFDRRLKALSPEDYAAVGAAIYSPRFRYRFVEGFRRGSLKDWFLLFLGRSYPRIKRLLSRI